MKKAFNINEYTKIREEAKKHFSGIKTGEQDLFNEQSRLFKPLIESTKDLENNLIQSTKGLENSLIQNQQELIEKSFPAIVNKVQESQGFSMMPQLEYEMESTPVKLPVKRIDLDGELDNEIHRKHLQDMNLELPSEVYVNNTIPDALKRITTMNRSIGQYLSVNSKKSEKEKEVYQSRKETLKIYESKIHALDEAIKKFEIKKGEGNKKSKKLIKLKRGRGRPKTNPDVIYYKKVDDLIQKLGEYCASKEAGNTGVDNYIISILDELLETKVIDKNDYDKMYKNIF